MMILFKVSLILGLLPDVLSVVIRCEEVDSIDVLTEASSEILYFWDCATRERCRGKVIRYNGEKYWACTTAASPGQSVKDFKSLLLNYLFYLLNALNYLSRQFNALKLEAKSRII